MNQGFNFMPQCAIIEALLNACLAVLPHAPQHEKEGLVDALRRFETFAAPTMWSANDVGNPDEDSIEGALTPEEKREAIARFVTSYNCTQADANAIEAHAQDILSERQVCIRVDFDPLYSGGVYQGTPQSAYVPLTLVHAFSLDGPASDGVDSAFGKHTKIDPMHIVGFDLEVKYNQAGERITGIGEENDGLTP